jgi:hypothetical protein
MAAPRDRTVHASYSGMEIVRYDRGGKWYLEPTDKNLKRQAASVRGAAMQAVWGLTQEGGQVFFGRPGGGMFDRLVRGDA